MDMRRLTIPVETGEHVSAILTLPPERKPGSEIGIIVAHGAGNDMENPLLAALADGLAKAGYVTLRFNFPYMEKGRKAPDRPEKLEKTWAAVYRYFRDDAGVRLSRIIGAGKSMGGRVASQMTARGTLPVQGLIFLGYPLHPAGDRENIRDTHLYQIRVPMLFFAGTRDPLCDMTKLQSVLGRLVAPWKLDIIAGGDHSFHTPKSMGISETAVFSGIVDKTCHWLEETFTGR